MAAEALDEIVVTAARLPGSDSTPPVALSVVEGDGLVRGYQQLGLDEPLTSIPGLFIQDRYNFAQDLRIAIRGFGARSSFGIRGIRLVVDDIPLTLPDGQGQLDSLDLASIGRVEVLRGPAAALYGNAGGGLIRVTTETAAAAPAASVGFSAGADDFARVRAKVNGTVAGNELLVSATSLDYGGYRDHAGTRQHLVNAVLRRAVGADGELALTLNIADQPEAEDPGGVEAAFAAATPSAARPRNVQFDAGETLDQGRFGVTYRHGLGETTHVRWRAYGVDREFNNRLPFTQGGQVVLDRRFVGGGVEFSGARGEAFSWLAGLDLDDQRDDRERFDNLDGVRGAQTFAQREAVRATGLYASFNWVPVPRWTVSAGARYDWLRFRVDDRFLADGDESGLRRFRAFNPVFGATVAVNDTHSLYANAARSFETPTTTEFANPGGGGFNPALDPARATSLEFGWRWQPLAAASVSAAVYRIDLDDELVPFELADQPDRDFFSNAGKSRRDGIELDASWQVVDAWRLSAAASVSDFRFREFVDVSGVDASGNRTPGIPRSTFSLSSDVLVGERGFVAIDVTRIARIALDNANTATQPAYVLVNARAGVEWPLRRSSVALYAGINNLTDEDYPANLRINAFGGRYFEPAPRRYFYGGFDWQFAL